MSNNAILINNVSPEKIEKLIDSIITKRFSILSKEFKNISNQDELLTRDETCKFLKIDSSTLWSWTNKGKVKAYGIGSRRYYKKNELLEDLKLLKKG